MFWGFIGEAIKVNSRGEKEKEKVKKALERRQIVFYIIMIKEKCKTNQFTANPWTRFLPSRFHTLSSIKYQKNWRYRQASALLLC